MLIENVLCKMRIEHGDNTTIRIILRKHGKEIGEIMTIENLGRIPILKDGEAHVKVKHHETTEVSET